MNKRPILLLLFTFLLLPCARMEGAMYTTMGNDRVLLMNNWKKGRISVKSQGYYDTEPTNTTYWVHSSGPNRTYGTGTNHVMYAQDGTPYWRLFNCRAGSGEGVTDLNWVPTSSYSLQSGTGRSTMKASASVIMRNALDAQVYSPYYEDGIGTIYFDAVNGYNQDGADVPTLQVQLATRVNENAASAGKTLASTDALPDDLAWGDPIPLTVFTVENGVLSSSSTEVRDLGLRAPAAGGTSLCYRVRATLNVREPVRFRIVRTTIDDTQSGKDADSIGLIFIDNIVVSYPAMSFDLHSYAPKYDDSLKGADVLGFVGDFTVPFLSVNKSGVRPHAYYECLTNGATRVQPVISNPRFHYRWRYLNQVLGDWKVIPMGIEPALSHIGVSDDFSVDLTDGVGDLEYFFTADVSSVYYNCPDYTFDTSLGWGTAWSENITAVTNRAAYTAGEWLPSGGTDYFTRIREGESNMERVQMVGTLSYVNKATGSNEVVPLRTPNGTVPRMTLVGDHSWSYHYQVPTNAIGGTLAFHLVTKEYYTNATGTAEWFVRTNNLYTSEGVIADIPHPMMLDAANPNDISVVLDASSTHLKIEYNDELRTLSLSHASYQTFNLWTDAMDGFRGMSGTGDSHKRYDAPFDDSWGLCPERNVYWHEDFNLSGYENAQGYPLDVWRSVGQTPNGWTARNAAFVEAARGDDLNLAIALDGRGLGSVGLEQFSKEDLPLGLDAVSFNARVTQSIRYEDFATYRDGLSCTNYAISAMVTMSRMKETATIKPTDMSPVFPSVSFVGYHRRKQGCYEFRMTRKTDTSLTLELHKWASSGNDTIPILLASKNYTRNLLVPTSDSDANGSFRTAAYFLVYTLVDGSVKLEGHLSSARTANGTGIVGDETGLAASSIAYVDYSPGVLARGGSYGVGSTDCRAGFGGIKIHSVSLPPSADASTAGDAQLNYPGTLEGRARLLEDWAFYNSRWEVDSADLDPNGGLSAVVPSNQVVQVWLSDASASGSDWFNSGYEVVVNSFSTNKYVVSPRMPGSWKVILKTGEEDSAGVVVDDVEITPWEGVETWGRNGNVYEYSDEWVYTKAWIAAAANITYNTKPYYLPDENVRPAGTNGYVLIFNEAGAYTFKPTANMEIDRILIVGGGGAGGNVMGGGGGGGQVREIDLTQNPVTLEAGSMNTFTVGAGGAYNGGNNQSAGADGQRTEIKINGTTYTANGGGGGGGWGSTAGRAGASGGGASNQSVGGNGTAGHKGGAAANGRGGGGGGAGEDGGNYVLGYTTTARTTLAVRNMQNPYYAEGGKGGDGMTSDITGTPVYYGGGGGGGAGWTLVSKNIGGEGGKGGGGKGADAHSGGSSATGGVAGKDGTGGGGGGGGGWNGTGNTFKANRGGAGGCGAVILRVRTAARQCVLQPSRGKDDYPMGLRSPYIDEGMSLFTFSYANADSNCVLLVQIATNMAPSVGTSYVPGLTTSLATNGDDVVWTTIARHDFSSMPANELTSGTLTTFIRLRQHWIYDGDQSQTVYTNVCGVVRLIVDPAVVSKVVNASPGERDSLVDYGKITITKAYCYNEPALDLRSWSGFNVHTEGWDGMGGAGPYAYLADWPDGLSLALNFSPKLSDNNSAAAKGIGLSAPDNATEYAAQNPFIQSAAFTSGVGTVSFRARLFDTNATRAVITLYGGRDPSDDQVQTESATWDVLTNFVVTTPTYQSFKWTSTMASSPYQAIRLEAAGARWGRCPSLVGGVGAWEWGNIFPRQEPINRVFIDDVSVGEPMLSTLDASMIPASVGGKTVSVPVEWFAEAEGWSVEQIVVHLDDARGVLEQPGRAANGRLSLADCYVLGLNPKDQDADFIITEFPFKADGSPDLENIKFEPSPEKWNVRNLTFKVKGSADLSGVWQEVPNGGDPTFRFFKVEVSLP